MRAAIFSGIFGAAKEKICMTVNELKKVCESIYYLKTFITSK